MGHNCCNEYLYKAIKGNWSLLGTDDVCGKTSEHISAPQLRLLFIYVYRYNTAIAMIR